MLSSARYQAEAGSCASPFLYRIALQIDAHLVVKVDLHADLPCPAALDVED
jgi:hypothetical protein